MSKLIELTPIKRYFLVRHLRYKKFSYEKIGDMLGISKQRAWQIFNSEIPYRTNSSFVDTSVPKNIFS